MKLEPAVWFDEIVKTYQLISPHIHHTQLITCPDLNEELGGQYLFKPESLQITGSFKVRGALSAISRLSEEELKRGVIAYSSGNHAQGVAHAAKVFNTPATVVMPKDAPIKKINTARELGAEVIFYDRRTESREEMSREIAKERNLVLINPYDALETIYGQGTAAFEVINDTNNPKLDNAIICAGGGGLAAGSCISIKHINSDCNIYTAEPAEWNDHQQSFEQNKRVKMDVNRPGLCDGLLTPTPGEIPFAINQHYGVSGLSASDQMICEAMSFAFNRLNLKLEPSGAVALACLLAHKEQFKESRTLVMLSGGNVDEETFSRCLGQASD
ncbi:threonine/serine dehydratase [Gammaproteobacteria bacterium]|nr:threonine/serine dehydratase [Gammaproteobacteria bacterium]|tara:strand:- start:299 stop:1285 length:987 start_codon:yes stop_codon:yes gene_type:complete